MVDEIKTKKKSSVELMLEKIQADMAEMAKDSKKKDEQIAMLTEIANESRKTKWNDKNLKNKIVPIVNLSIINGKIVTSWSMLLDEVFKDSNGNWIENQLVQYNTEDGEKHKMNLVDAARKVKKIPAEVVAVAVENVEEGLADTEIRTYTYKVKPEGRKEEIEISSKYIN